MNFASLEFGVLLLAVFSAYYFLPQRARMALLLVASYVFYCYWDPFYGLLIFVSTLLDYAAALAIGAATSQRARRWPLWISVVGNLSLLGYFKYTNFALDSLRALLGPLGSHLPGMFEVVLPAGISFYTFQTMSYTIDVYRGKIAPERDFLSVALYVAFFPQLVAGPIERAADLMPQLQARQRFRLADLEAGVRLILWGLFKKIVVADRLAAAGYPAYLDPGAYDSGMLAFAAAALFVAIYLDFSAYSEIARGVARLFGVHLSENFRFPHAAGDIAEYWRRWHITMSTWVRDYLFIPLGGFRPRRPWQHARTILLTMGLVGLWHGASWTFVLWGLLHGASLVVYHRLRLGLSRRPGLRSVRAGLAWRLGSWALTTTWRILLSVLFFAPDFPRALAFFEGLLWHPSWRGFTHPTVALGFALLIGFWIFHYLHAQFAASRSVDFYPALLRGSAYALLAVAVLLFAEERSLPFIYFRF